jgi:serine acetyltransferase
MLREVMTMFRMLREDIRAVLERDPAARSGWPMSFIAGGCS